MNPNFTLTYLHLCAAYFNHMQNIVHLYFLTTFQNINNPFLLIWWTTFGFILKFPLFWIISIHVFLSLNYLIYLFKYYINSSIIFLNSNIPFSQSYHYVPNIIISISQKSILLLPDLLIWIPRSLRSSMKICITHKMFTKNYQQRFSSKSNKI